MGKEYVITGNSALMKCEIPSFVADLVQIVSWHDNLGNAFSQNHHGRANIHKLLVWLWQFPLSTYVVKHNHL